MKRDLLFTSEFQFAPDAYRAFSVNLLATPRNFILRKLIDSQFSGFRVINHVKSDKIEIRSSTMRQGVEDSIYLDKESVKNSLALSRNFVVVLNNSKLKIPIPRYNFDWLFETGRENAKWSPAPSEHGNIFFNVEDDFTGKFNIKDIAYYKHELVNDMSDISPF